MKDLYHLHLKFSAEPKIRRTFNYLTKRSSPDFIDDGSSITLSSLLEKNGAGGGRAFRYISVSKSYRDEERASNYNHHSSHNETREEINEIA